MFLKLDQQGLLYGQSIVRSAGRYRVPYDHPGAAE
jgi:hypothetical protein